MLDVLVIFADEIDRARVLDVPGYRFHFMDAPLVHWRPIPDFNILKYLEDCRSFLRKHRVDGVLSFHDLGDLVAAVLAEESGLPGPGVEAVFLCLHKYYSRRCEADPIDCRALYLDRPPPRDLRFPCYLKPPWLKLSLLGFRIDDEEDLRRALRQCRLLYPAWAEEYLSLFREVIDSRRYPMAAAPILLLEELVEGDQVTVEGWVAEDRSGIWAVTDTNAYPGNGRIFDNFSLPSRQPVEVQSAVATAALEAIARTGFRRGCFNAEFWWCDGRAVLTELNGRSAASFEGLYRRCLDASVFENALALACGLDPIPPPVPTGRVGGQFNLITMAAGEARDLLDFGAARQIPQFKAFVEEGSSVRPAGDLGTVLGQIELFGADYEEIAARADAIRRRLLKRPQGLPWRVASDQGKNQTKNQTKNLTKNQTNLTNQTKNQTDNPVDCQTNDLSNDQTDNLSSQTDQANRVDRDRDRPISPPG